MIVQNVFSNNSTSLLFNDNNGIFSFYPAICYGHALYRTAKYYSNSGAPNNNSTSCDFVTPWLRSTELNCLHLDEVNHNHILQKNRDIWRCLYLSMAMFGHNGPPLFYCDIPQHNAIVHTGNVLAKFYRTCFGEFLTMAYHGRLLFERGQLWFESHPIKVGCR